MTRREKESPKPVEMVDEGRPPSPPCELAVNPAPSWSLDPRPPACLIVLAEDGVQLLIASPTHPPASTEHWHKL